MVDVIHYEIANKNKTIGYVDIRVPILQPTVLIFRRISHVQAGDRKWFNLPSFQREGSAGESIYHKFCQFEQEKYNNNLLGSLGQKVEEFCEKNGISRSENNSLDPFLKEDLFDLPF